MDEAMRFNQRQRKFNRVLMSTQILFGKTTAAINYNIGQTTQSLNPPPEAAHLLDHVQQLQVLKTRFQPFQLLIPQSVVVDQNQGAALLTMYNAIVVIHNNLIELWDNCQVFQTTYGMIPQPPNTPLLYDGMTQDNCVTFRKRQLNENWIEIQ